MGLPLRWVIILPMIVLLALSNIALITYVERTVSAQLMADLDREVHRAAVGSRIEPLPGPIDDYKPEQLTVSADGTVTPVERSSVFTPEEIAELVAAPGEIKTVGATPGYRALAVRDVNGGGSRIFALSLRPMAATLTQLRVTLVVAGLAIFLGTVFVLWLASRRVTKPVDALASAAQSIAGGDLSVGIPEMQQTRETRTLSLALQEMVNQLSSQLRDRDDALARAGRAAAEQKRVVAEMAHELLTPLTAVAGYSQLYERGMLTTPAAIDHAMSRIGAGAQRLTVLVQSVSNLDRAGATSRSSWDLVDLRHLAEGVCSDLRAAFSGRVIDLDVPAGECVVWGDPEALQQVLLNLGANACKHTPPGSGVRVEVSADDLAVEVRVIDHGPGIPVEAREQVFEAFYRLDRSPESGSTSGAGLGLAITRAVVEQHQGTISIEDTDGGGATVVLRLQRTPVAVG
ncbi:MAG: hypothetical protein CVT62_12265 [Actinobacteria bacterium HGW-Actinobacteria-2]|nr:MAG: hypothetical protein CVT62_12265 [Actinobacteria bacterium HGW-Actinobacteria-2]